MRVFPIARMPVYKMLCRVMDQINNNVLNSWTFLISLIRSIWHVIVNTHAQIKYISNYLKDILKKIYKSHWILQKLQNKMLYNGHNCVFFIMWNQFERGFKKCETFMELLIGKPRKKRRWKLDISPIYLSSFKCHNLPHKTGGNHCCSTLGESFSSPH